MQTTDPLQFLPKYHVNVVIKNFQKKFKSITFFDEMFPSFTPYFNSLKATYFELPACINYQPNIFSNDHFNFHKRKELGM